MPKDRIDGMSEFETLLKKNDIRYEDRWAPHFVDPFKVIVSQGILSGIPNNIRNNIAYNMQYLQYLQLQLEELKLHNVIGTLLYKTYIITAMSIIEAIFYQALKNGGKWTMTEWEEIKKVSTTEFEDGDSKKKMEVTILQRCLPKEGEMDFNTIINKIQEKKLLGLDKKHFPDIKKLKSLRNRVHLQIGEGSSDTDYWKFNHSDYLLARKTLYCVLSDPSIMVDAKYLSTIEFLNVDDKNDL